MTTDVHERMESVLEHIREAGPVVPHRLTFADKHLRVVKNIDGNDRLSLATLVSRVSTGSESDITGRKDVELSAWKEVQPFLYHLRTETKRHKRE